MGGDRTRCITGLELEKSKPVTFSVQNVVYATIEVHSLNLISHSIIIMNFCSHCYDSIKNNVS